ncbi:hypothetical protein Ahy_A07g034483 isoform C [Arachis hypogaea]|uniref:Uncharacterized protein n=1 Tax=Arachis hypogaea TaxID=3818 RepID=A0A445CBZ8_ARAHY|nr:hypothetical protein Ahy_A07g034483 isoform C [Arachis hypogaea]
MEHRQRKWSESLGRSMESTSHLIEEALTIKKISEEDMLLCPFRKDREFTTKTRYYVAKKKKMKESTTTTPHQTPY